MGCLVRNDSGSLRNMMEEENGSATQPPDLPREKDGRPPGDNQKPTLKNSRRISTNWRRSCNIQTRYVIIIAIVFVILVVTLAWHSRASPSWPSCPKYWITYEGKCYNFSDTEGTWNSSQNNCTLYGASLVLVDTPEEMAFVRRYKGNTDYWIGLRREAVGEPWKWPNGSVFNNWFRIGADGSCAYLNDESASSTWCYTQRNWICSKFLHAP